MLRHKIKSIVLKKNTLKQKAYSNLVMSQPRWTLFERMDYADKLYNQPKPVDFVQQQSGHKQRSQNQIEISAEDFTEIQLLSQP